MRIKEIYRQSLWFQLFLASVVGILVYNASIPAEDAEEWMPDLNLRHAIFEKLGVETLTITDMQRLYHFVADGKFKQRSSYRDVRQKIRSLCECGAIKITSGVILTLTPLGERNETLSDSIFAMRHNRQSC